MESQVLSLVQIIRASSVLSMEPCRQQIAIWYRGHRARESWPRGSRRVARDTFGPAGRARPRRAAVYWGGGAWKEWREWRQVRGGGVSEAA